MFLQLIILLFLHQFWGFGKKELWPLKNCGFSDVSINIFIIFSDVLIIYHTLAGWRVPMFARDYHTYILQMSYTLSILLNLHLPSVLCNGLRYYLNMDVLVTAIIKHEIYGLRLIWKILFGWNDIVIFDWTAVCESRILPSLMPPLQIVLRRDVLMFWKIEGQVVPYVPLHCFDVLED